MKCPECLTGNMVLKDSKFGKFYGCDRWPDCTATHSAHQKTGLPMGIPADKETKAWRVKAHEAFDDWWKNKFTKRQLAYLCLRTYFRMRPEHCHIGRFSIDECQAVIYFCEKHKNPEQDENAGRR